MLVVWVAVEVRAAAERVGVVVIKAVLDELGVLVVAGEENRFAQLITCGITAALRHQDFQGLVDGVGIEQPAVDRP